MRKRQSQESGTGTLKRDLFKKDVYKFENPGVVFKFERERRETGSVTETSVTEGTTISKSCAAADSTEPSVMLVDVTVRS